MRSLSEELVQISEQGAAAVLATVAVGSVLLEALEAPVTSWT